MPAPAVEFRGITKRFGNLTANSDISFTVPSASLYGVVGENGAGKSTIMKVLYGLYQPDAGEILLDGVPTRISSPFDAIHRGIGMVHQHFMQVPTLSVWRNVILGSEPTLGRLREKEIVANIDLLQKEFGFHLDLEATIESLAVGQQQQVEILKLLYRKADFLILDEPTAVLTPQETDTLFEKLRGLWQRGKSIVLISHKLREILAFTQIVTVMRKGQVVATAETKTLDKASLAELIVGRKQQTLPEERGASSPEAVVNATAVSLERRKKALLENISFEIHRGEIVGIAGVEGNGQEPLIEVLSGVERHFTGEVLFNGQPMKNLGPARARKEGIALIPANRLAEAAVTKFPMTENLMLGRDDNPALVRRGVVLWKRVANATASLMKAFDVRPPQPSLPFANFSGGNQQKFVVGRETQYPVKFLIAAHPTRGVDIGAIEFIHRHFLSLREKGAGILLVSSELEEILALSDRILVLYGGKISGEVRKGPDRCFDVARIGRLMTGGAE